MKTTTERNAKINAVVDCIATHAQTDTLDQCSRILRNADSIDTSALVAGIAYAVRAGIVSAADAEQI